jgi:tetratricopeptide (TPR) repeat protein
MKKIQGLIGILFLLYSCGEAVTNDVESFFADSLTGKEKSELRLSELEGLLAEQPDNQALWVEKGYICKEQYDFVCALDAGAKAYAIDSTNVEARMLYAWTLMNKPNTQLVDIERAKKHYKYVLSVKANDPAVMVELANTFSLTGDFETAFKYVNDALRIDDKFRDAYVLKGSMYKTQGNTKFALSSYQTAVQVDPDFFMGHLNIGWLLSEMEDHVLALEYYKNALELDPESINAYYGVAKSYQDMGQFDEAQAYYRQLLQVDPDFHYAYFNQGIIKQYFQAQLDSAVYYYDLSTSVQPEFVKGWHQLGEVYLNQGRKPDAARVFSKVLELNPDYKPTLLAKEKLR